MENIKNDSNDAEEIARSLKLAIAQIEMSMRESDQSVQQLIDSITAMTGCLHQVNACVYNYNDVNQPSIFEEIQTYTSRAHQYMRDAVLAFQFYDRLSQRFTHIEENLRAIADLVLKPDQQHPELWRNLEKKLRSVYSTEQEQTMYQALLHGISETQIMQNPALSNTDQKAGEIELF